MLKKLGGEQQKVSGKLEIECLKDKSDQDGAEAVAEEFARVSQEYKPIQLEELPPFLPACQGARASQYISSLEQDQVCEKNKVNTPDRST